MATINQFAAQNITVNIFDALFEAATDVEFNPRWHNGTGYFDRATEEFFGEGVISRCMTDDNRRMVFISQDTVSLVIFDHHSGNGQQVSNTPRGIMFIRDEVTGKMLRDEDGHALRETNRWHLFESRTNSNSLLNDEIIKTMIDTIIKDSTPIDNAQVRARTHGAELPFTGRAISDI